MVNTLTRGMRNAMRNTIRTTSIVIILGISIGLALAMLVARAAVQDKITSVKSTIGNTIAITPAGIKGFMGGGEPLTAEQLDKVRDIAHVTGLTETLTDRLTPDNSSLVSAIDAGSLGKRGGNVIMSPKIGMDGQPVENFTIPVVVTAANSTDYSTLFGTADTTFTSGALFDVTKDENVAVIGKDLAEKNALSVGSTFTAYGTTITVAGIYDTGTVFGNNGVAMPLAALQRLSAQANNITSASATVDSIDNVDAAVDAIKAALGDTADVVSSQETAAAAIEPLESVKTISTFSLIGAIIAGAGVILLTMVMIVRERRREIGVFKAIGASNLRIMLQFMSEAVTLTLLAMVAGVIIGAAAASPLTNMLVTSNANAATVSSPNGPSIQNGRKPSARIVLDGKAGPLGPHALGGKALAGARSVQASVGWDIVAYGFVAALIIAIVGSALPAFFIAKIRPAEVMRAE